VGAHDITPADLRVHAKGLEAQARLGVRRSEDSVRSIASDLGSDSHRRSAAPRMTHPHGPIESLLQPVHLLVAGLRTHPSQASRVTRRNRTAPLSETVKTLHKCSPDQT
jgi:hypothetical protein